MGNAESSQVTSYEMNPSLGSLLQPVIDDRALVRLGTNSRHCTFRSGKVKRLPARQYTPVARTALDWRGLSGYDSSRHQGTYFSQKGKNALSKSIRVFTSPLLVLFLANPADAAQLKLLLGGAVTESVRKIGAEFSRKTAHQIDVTTNTSGAL